MSILILLNGPPRCGKDTAAEFLVKNHGYVKRKMTEPMDRAIAQFLDIHPETFAIMREEFKDQGVLPGNCSMRKALIEFSERFAKPCFGKNIFGRIMARQFSLCPAPRVVMSDCGFADEILPFIGAFKSVAVVSIFRPGCTYKDDSRGYIAGTIRSLFNESSVTFPEVENKRGLGEFFERIEQIHLGLEPSSTSRVAPRLEDIYSGRGSGER